MQISNTLYCIVLLLNIQIKVYAYGEFIAKIVPETYVETTKDIQEKFNNLINHSNFDLKNHDVGGFPFSEMENNS